MKLTFEYQAMIKRAGSNAQDPKPPGFGKARQTAAVSRAAIDGTAFDRTSFDGGVLSRRLTWIIAAALTLTASLSASAIAQEQAHVTVRATRTIQIDVAGGELLKFGEDVGTVFVADPSIADIQAPSPASIFLFGKKSGRTSLFALRKDGTPLVSYTVDVHFPAAELQQLLNADAGGAAHLAYTSQGAVLTGSVPDAGTADRIVQTAQKTLGGVPVVNHLQVTGPVQVNLRVRVAEVDRTVSRQLGFNWNLVGQAGSVAIGLQTGNLAGAAAGSTALQSAVNNIFGTVASSRVNGATVIDAMASEGLVSMLAEPNLTAESGATATFLAGGEIPIPIGQGLGATSVQYKQFGVSISFTPTVLATGHINMKISPEVSSLDTANSVQFAASSTATTTLPALTTRRAETTVDLASGQSFAVAGLIQNNDSNVIQKIPAVGDLPVVGALFRSSQFQRNQTELVIIVTPYVVHPTGPATPPDDTNSYVRVPSDADTLVYGRPASVTRKAVRPPPSRVVDVDGLSFQ
jgi:pilus assembly protein CpaC